MQVVIRKRLDCSGLPTFAGAAVFEKFVVVTQLVAQFIRYFALLASPGFDLLRA